MSDSSWVHEHRCQGCDRSRECENPLCFDPRFEPDLCLDCAGARVYRHNLVGIALLLVLSACAPLGRASEGVRDGAPYYYGVPGGTPIETRLPGSAR